MAWYEEAVFYHIYPLGLTGAPKQNDYGQPVHRLKLLIPWITHIRRLGFTALYIGPLFESVGHGYETTDYRKLDSRLGTNEDLTAFVRECHNQGLRVILDGVFNHTGRDFFAFQDLKANRENSPYRDWYCNVNFWGNNEYNDGFSYDNWGGYNLLVKLNQRNPAVRDYICDVIHFWVLEFDIDGIRLDAADVLDFDFMKALRYTAGQVKPDFWLMGEVIHGDYSRWANHETLHAVTNYMLHKAFYSGHNDHNYFEIAHTIRYIGNMTGRTEDCRSLYTFVDNHDVERISTILREKAHYLPVHILLYTLPGIPSVYYGSEFGIDGEKHRGGSDDAIRPSIHLADFDPACEKEAGEDGIVTTAKVAPGLDPDACQALIAHLGKLRATLPALSYGSYEERCLTTGQYAFARRTQEQEVLVAVNNAGDPAGLSIAAADGIYMEQLTHVRTEASGGRLQVTLDPNSGGIWVKEKAVIIDNETDEKTGTSSDSRDLTTKTPEREEDEAMTKVPVSEGEPGPVSGPKSEPEPERKPAAHSPITVTVPVKDGETQAGTDQPEPDCVPDVPAGPLEEMTVSQLQKVILQKLSERGPVTELMRAQVKENIWKDSLLNWARSFS